MAAAPLQLFAKDFKDRAGSTLRQHAHDRSTFEVDPPVSLALLEQTCRRHKFEPLVRSFSVEPAAPNLHDQVRFWLSVVGVVLLALACIAVGHTLGPWLSDLAMETLSAAGKLRSSAAAAAAKTEM